MPWAYSDTIADKEIVKSAFRISACPFCRTKLEYHQADENATESRSNNFLRQIEFLEFDECPACGWWRLGESGVEHVKYAAFFFRNGASARLKNFDSADLSIPLEEVRNFLTARYDLRFKVNPKMFEETVASIFEGLGYRVRVTSYTKDNGIDVILDGPDDCLMGVQVKRYKNSIKVESIRALTGALLLGGYTKGIFVTTSEFQAGCADTASLARLKGYPIELFDAKRLYDALKLSQINRYNKRSHFLELYDSIGLDGFVNLDEPKT